MPQYTYELLVQGTGKSAKYHIVRRTQEFTGHRSTIVATGVNEFNAKLLLRDLTGQTYHIEEPAPAFANHATRTHEIERERERNQA